MKDVIVRRSDVFWFLVTAILISIAFRWPLTYHETGIDSFYVHGLATSATQFGEMRWLVNPLSLFGLYSMSYASGVPILLAEFSTMTGLTMEGTILVFSVLIAIIAALAAFLLGLEIRNSPPFAFAISIIYSSCPMLLFSTQWSIGTRSMFMAILPFTLWLMVRLGKYGQGEADIKKRRAISAIFLITLLLMALIHRLFFMIIIFIIAYFIARRIYKLLGPQREIFISQVKWGRRYSILMILIPVMIATASMVLLAYYAGWLGLDSYDIGFFKGDSIIVRLLNLLASVAATIGFPIAFLFPIGLIILLRSKNRGFLGIFFLASFLLILPFSGGRQYERWLYPVVLGVLILVPAYLIVSSKKRRLYTKVIFIAVLMTMPINLVLVDYYNRWPESKVVDDGISTPDHAYMTALYYGYYFNGEYFTGNNGFLASHIQAYTDSPDMPGDVIDLLIYGVINNEDIDAELVSLEDFLSGKGTLFSTHWEEILAYDWAIMYLYKDSPADAADILTRYDVHMFIEDTRLNGKILGYEGVTLYPREAGQARFIEGVHELTYKIYDNGIDIIWKI